MQKIENFLVSWPIISRIEDRERNHNCKGIHIGANVLAGGVSEADPHHESHRRGDDVDFFCEIKTLVSLVQ